MRPGAQRWRVAHAQECASQPNRGPARLRVLHVPARRGCAGCAGERGRPDLATSAVIISSQPAQVGGGLVYVHVYEYVHEHVYVGPAAPGLEDTP